MENESQIDNLTDEQFDEFFSNQSKQAKDEPVDVGTDDKATAQVDGNSEKETEDSANKAPRSDESSEGNEEGEGGEQQNDTERYKAMAESERVKRKEIQKQIDDMKRENDQLKSTFNKIVSKAQEQAEAASKPQAPNFEDDPIGALRFENEQLKKQLGGVQERFQKADQHQEQYQKQSQFVNEYQRQAREFSKTNPDFDSAYNFLSDNRFNEYVAAGYTEQQAEQLLIEDEAAMVANAMQRGQNPGEVIYKLAKLRGYQNKPVTNDQEAAQDKIKANEQKIATLEKGIQASRSVNTSGTSTPNNLTLEGIAEMDDDDFSKVDWNKVLKMG